MYRSDGHLCKQDPLKVAQFYMESSSHMTNIFRGFLMTDMYIVKHLPSQSPENPHEGLNGTTKVRCSRCTAPSVDQNVFDFMGFFRKGINYMRLAMSSWGWLAFLRQVWDPPPNLEQVYKEETLVDIECHENQKSVSNPSHTPAKVSFIFCINTFKNIQILCCMCIVSEPKEKNEDTAVSTEVQKIMKWFLKKSDKMSLSITVICRQELH